MESGPALRVDVLGPLRLTVGGHVLDRPELRRGRVRTILALLAVRGPLRRDELIEIVWPDTDLDRARQNLRTTLTRLRHLVEPERSGATSGTRLRTDGEVISLAHPPSVDVDLWQFRRLVARSGGTGSDVGERRHRRAAGAPSHSGVVRRSRISSRSPDSMVTSNVSGPSWWTPPFGWASSC